MAGAKKSTTSPSTTTTSADFSPPVIVRDHAITGPPPSPPANHEAALTGVMALAYLFSNCVEAFGLVHPGFRFEKTEQVLICALGIQQARLLIWGDCVGVTSPPPTVTDRAVPKHPSAAYPDLKEPTFFNARDARLDDPEVRVKIDEALSAIVDRSSHTSREEMMELYGLRPPKKFTVDHQPPLDTNRLESFRERFELLKEVAESYAHISTKRNSSIVATPWGIADLDKFANFVKASQERVDYLVDLMGVRERVDRAVRMDIRGMGWHLTADRQRIALDTSKLKLIQEACKDEYPQYVSATEEALWNIDREHRENAADYNPYSNASIVPVSTPYGTGSHMHGAFSTRATSGRGSIAAPSGVTNGATNGANASKAEKKHSIFGSLFKRKSAGQVPTGRSNSLAVPSTSSRPTEPPRSLSDVGQFPSSGEAMTHPSAPEEPAESNEPPPNAIRSKSVGDILDAPINTAEEEETRLKLEQMRTMEDDVVPPAPSGPAASSTTEAEEAALAPEGNPGAQRKEKGHSDGLGASIAIHDQYHGLGRQGTKTQW